MAELVNLRRVRKDKARTEAAAQADANRMKHGVPKRERDFTKAGVEKAQHAHSTHKLDEK
jgi:hypothetical protein